jgi:hypothetical protein
MAFWLTGAIDAVSHPNPVLGVFFVSCGALFTLLMAGGLAGGCRWAACLTSARARRATPDYLHAAGGSRGAHGG